MKKRTVVLCELCTEDILAATIVHWGLCGDHVAVLGNAAVNGSDSGNGKRRKPYAKRLHKKCGQQIDPRGWSKHVGACKGKGKVRS